MSRADLGKDPEEVSSMFDGVAKRYDIVNDLLSLGQTKRWRKKVQTIINPTKGMTILDIAAGPGSSSEPLFKAGADVTSLDFSEGMLEQGRKARPYLKFVKGDALNLPFADGTFDLTTISFGLRNTHDYKKALQEALRVTKSGGRMVIVEFSTPTFAPFRILYMNYLMKALPKLARRTSSNPAAYVYLAESIRAWPTQEQLASDMSAAGWTNPSWVNLTGGVVAVHTAIKAP
ncbi:MAG: demethylmenaquinone methyltransferase [Actinobacteria bacterium]|nr:demethylmenaquinone methyltransferase [Actinomycetota bacterium]NCZ85492.1 demethylmenaquinone methyltransferase [Burkholderiaceae bacterium]